MTTLVVLDPPALLLPLGCRSPRRSRTLLLVEDMVPGELGASASELLVWLLPSAAAEDPLLMLIMVTAEMAEAIESVEKLRFGTEKLPRGL